MTTVRLLQRSFAGGEVTPEFWGRIDDQKYQTGLARCRNFIVKPQGPLENRAGSVFVREVKDSSKATRLITFTYSTTQTMVIELGHQYLRFHTAAATLLYSAPAAWVTTTGYVVGDLRSNSGTNYYCTTAHTSGTFATDLAAGKWYALPADLVYEIPTPYDEADLFDIHYVQSADVMTLVHPGYAPRELRRMGATNWQLSVISFASSLSAPTGLSATATGGTGTTYEYVVTAVASMGTDESVQSSAATCNGNLFATGAYNTVSWSSVSGADRYYVYKLSGGIYGYVGQSTTTSFKDDNIAADTSRTPPIAQSLFAATGDYPGAVSYYEQRRTFAGTLNAPQNIWMSKSGTESNMNYSLPIRDDDSIQFRVAAREANTIRHIVPLTDMLLLTSGAEWRITSNNTDALTPASISVKPQSYVGTSNVQPVVIANSIVYAAARGGHVREMAYAWQAGGYISGDLSIRAPHLFDEMTVVDLAYAKSPYPIVWAVSSGGVLLGLTYLPEQQIGAWHWHDTDGLFESVTVVAEGEDDVPYLIVQRTIDGQSKRYVECLHSRRFAAQEDAFFVDCGLTYDGVPADTFTGLDHLEGKTVSILGDGAVMEQQVVSGGSITLPREVSVAQIGLPITADLQTLPLAYEASDFGQGRAKNVNKVTLRVYRSGGIWVGPDWDKLTEAKQRTTEVWGDPPALKTGEVAVVVTPSWADGGQLCVRQADPLPLTVASMVVEAVIGG